VQHRDARELLARYLHAVETRLPSAQAADIIAELSDSIQSRMEEREAELGRSLTTDEQSAILVAYGPPTMVASRYWRQQQLIGPMLLPYYWYTLKIVLWCALALNAVAFVVGATTRGGPAAAFVHVWGTALGSLFVSVGAVTVVFALFERFAKSDSLVRNWDPRSLPAVNDGRSVPRATSVIELVLNVVFLSWLLNVPFVRNLIGYAFLGPTTGYFEHLPFQLTPAWRWGIVALLVVSFVHAILSCITLVRPDWVRLRATTFVVTNAALLAVAVVVMQSHPLVEMIPGAGDAGAAATFNQLAFWGLASFAAVCLLTMLVYLRTLVRRPGAGDAQMIAAR
jgi:hypothetical protein